jgi:O-acetyl-ADP-ribose deacetylase (regulator of RNase III)
VKREIGKTLVSLVQGDITEEKVDAIVNAANSSLMGGGGVDGAIHRAGGPAIREECERIRAKTGRLPTGEAVITTAGDLPSRFVIHTVGPVWSGGDKNEPQLLENAYRNSLRIGAEHELTSVAFPSISTGAYGYPIEKAAEIAVTTVCSAVRESTFGEVRFVLFSREDLDIYRGILGRVV